MSEQLALFAERGPEGLRDQPDFITGEEERTLVARLKALPLAPFQFGAFEGKRRVASFGWRYDYSAQRVLGADPLPDWIAPFARRVEAFTALPEGDARQPLCTEYDAGVGIGWHRDKAAFELVFGLSLVSSCKLRFRKIEKGAWKRFTLDAAPRSLYLMSGDARRVWEHSIPPVEALRYSITFRTMAAR
jgi:alkylated DNA repair dioxygenase AlkB